MKKFKVTFTYTQEWESEDEDEAARQAWVHLIDGYDCGDMDVEEIGEINGQ